MGARPLGATGVSPLKKLSMQIRMLSAIDTSLRLMSTRFHFKVVCALHTLFTGFAMNHIYAQYSTTFSMHGRLGRNQKNLKGGGGSLENC